MVVVMDNISICININVADMFDTENNIVALSEVVLDKQLCTV